ncbi:hypothetical protein H2200_010056 [Cladophialophora chaetospira]|uniref:F-box domain-containing protein n=1 Tax=Cladophialophora chaetospira TaxID=386627 RepID=A0AA38X235_9EURO|nr:hypothetical protein H2200_010056 [Cladophialophora chaetospira]
MTDSPISTLPPEVLHQVLKYLPIATLLRFGQTSQRNYSAATLALQNLRLAILPRHLHGVLAFLSSSTFDDIDTDVGNSCYDNPGRNQVIVTSPLPEDDRHSRSKRRSPAGHAPAPAQYREKLFDLQNDKACKILSTPALASLSTLTLHIYHITSSSLTEILATRLPNLRDLRLNFYHPYLHDTCLPAQYWTNPVFLQPSPIWNTLAGVGEKSNANLRLRSLKKLTVERAGITSFQLRKWIECNPNLSELRLRNIAGVDSEFVQWLGRYYHSCKDERSDETRPAKLRMLSLESCSALTAESVEELGWLDSLFGLDNRELCDPEAASGLRALSLRCSTSIKTTALCAYLELKQPALQQVTLPDGRVLTPKIKTRKRSRPDASKKQNGTSGTSTYKRPRATSTQPPNHDLGDHGNHGTEPSTVDLNLETLTIDEDESEDEDSSDDENSASSSPVSYLRLSNRFRPRRGCRFNTSDIIEPDPDAV